MKIMQRNKEILWGKQIKQETRQSLNEFSDCSSCPNWKSRTHIWISHAWTVFIPTLSLLFLASGKVLKIEFVRCAGFNQFPTSAYGTHLMLEMWFHSPWAVSTIDPAKPQNTPVVIIILGLLEGIDQMQPVINPARRPFIWTTKHNLMSQNVRH